MSDTSSGGMERDGGVWIGPGTWIWSTQIPLKKLGVVTEIHEPDRGMAARLSIRWYPNCYQNTSVMLALENFKSGVWTVDDDRTVDTETDTERDAQ